MAVAGQDDLSAELSAGHGDVIVASLDITPSLAGVMLMARYSAWFNSPDVPAKDRIRFALASYNCGPGHVQDARALAKDMGLNPNKWFGNVERAMLLLKRRDIAKKSRYGFCHCDEPINYVSQIQSRYDTYAKLVPLQ